MIELKDAKLFKDLPAAELVAIQSQMKIVRHAAGHEITVRGEGGVGFMTLLDGTVVVETAQGRKRKLGPGDSFGEMALLDHEGRSATIRAESEVSLASIPEWSFKPFIHEHPEVAYRMLQTLSLRIRQAESG